MRVLMSILSAAAVSAAALPSTAQDQIREITKAVISMCRGGTVEGTYSDYSISGNGELTTVILKSIVNVSGGGKFVFGSGEWEGIKAVVPKEFDQQAYTACVSDVMGKFISKLP